MGANTSIEWTATRHADGTVTPGATWNPIRGCTKVSRGCDNCYAMSVAYRFSGPGKPYEGLARKVNGRPAWTNRIELVPEHLADPLHWRKPRLVFVNSMSDLFHPDLPQDYLDWVFAVMAEARQHTFQVLTKRPERMRVYLNAPDVADRVSMTALWGNRCAWPLPNVWLGTSVEDQAAADERIPRLLQTPAAVRFLSCEPLLGPLNLDPWLWELRQHYDADTGEEYGDSEPTGDIDWIIGGGESGPRARPWHPAWARSLRDQCVQADVPFFWKQNGAWRPDDGYPQPLGNALSALMHRDGRYYILGAAAMPMWVAERQGCGDQPDVYMRRVGKKAAGRLLDGVEWNEMPT